MLVGASVVGTVAVLGVAALVLGFLSPAAMDTEQSRVTVRDDHIAFDIKVPEGTAISTIDVEDETEGCARVSYTLNDHGLVVEAVSRTCRVPDEQISNGHHGVYRTLKDVPEPSKVATVRTWLGPAKVFTQSYSEHTNVSNSWDEPVAIVTLDDPVDADYPTLVVRSDKAALTREEFTHVVEDLAEPT